MQKVLLFMNTWTLAKLILEVSTLTTKSIY